MLSNFSVTSASKTKKKRVMDLAIKVGDPEDLKNRDGESYTVYPITIEYNDETWEIKRRYK